MKFAITASDRYLGVFEAFLNAGWIPLKLFTSDDVENIRDCCKSVIRLAERHGAAVQITRMTPRDLEELSLLGCETLIVASYKWRIYDWSPFLKYAINFHCSPLPLGRGPYPPITAIMKGMSSWGVTCHRLTREFDRGDILDTERFPLSADECHDSLDLKIQMAAGRLAKRVASGFEALWNEATPQGEGSYWPSPTPQERTIDFSRTTDQIMLTIRAFGSNGCFAAFDDSWAIVSRAVAWKEAHAGKPGEIVLRYGRAVVVTTADGYLGLIDYQKASMPPPPTQSAKESA